MTPPPLSLPTPPAPAGRAELVLRAYRAAVGEQSTEQGAPEGALRGEGPGAGEKQAPAGEKAPQSGTEQPGGPPPRQPGPSDACGTPQLLIFGGFFVLMYFLMIRPQQKQEKARREMLKAVQKNDWIVTSGGIHGQIVTIDEKIITLKVGSGDGVRLRIDRSAVGRVLPKNGDKKDSES